MSRIMRRMTGPQRMAATTTSTNAAIQTGSPVATALVMNQNSTTIVVDRAKMAMIALSPVSKTLMISVRRPR